MKYQDLNSQEKFVAWHRGQDGISTLGGLFAAALIFISFLAYTRTQNFSNILTLNAKISGSFYEVDDLVRNNLSRLFQDLGSDCNFDNQTLLANIEFSPGIELRHFKEMNLEQGKSHMFDQALQRCNEPAFPADRTNPMDNLFHFCLALIKVDSSVTENLNQSSFLKSDPIFFELSAEIVDFKTGEPQSCEAFEASSGTSLGINIYYTTYWQQKIRGKNKYKFRHEQLRLRKKDL